MTILVLHGPNLNRLGERDPLHYGRVTLEQIDNGLKQRAKSLGLNLICVQSNQEGILVDFLQNHGQEAQGIIINPGALTHYGLSLRDALEDTNKPIIEVHLSNIYAREEWRKTSVIAPVARGQISGLGWRGYLLALDAFAQILGETALADAIGGEDLL